MNSWKIGQPVFLCGMMGSGKSTIGEKLADKLDVPFRDLDLIIEENEKMSIPEIFNLKQEDGFRSIERKLLIQLAGNVDGVIALGGGSLQNQQIVDHLKLNGWLIYIDASRQNIIERLSKPSGRPMLENTEDLEQRIHSLFEQRIQYYEQAHIIIQTVNRSIDEITTEIVKKLRLYEGRNYR